MRDAGDKGHARKEQVGAWECLGTHQGTLFHEEDWTFDDSDLDVLAADWIGLSVIQRVPTRISEDEGCEVWGGERIYHVEELYSGQLQRYLGSGACWLDVRNAPRTQVHDGNWCACHDDISFRVHSGPECGAECKSSGACDQGRSFVAGC